MPATVQVVLAEGDWVALEEYLRGAWQPVEHGGLPFNDVTQEIEIIRHPDPFSWLSGQVAWSIRLQLPWEPSTEQRLRVRVASRAQFPGFTREIL
jgi:hypothetical protein